MISLKTFKIDKDVIKKICFRFLKSAFWSFIGVLVTVLFFFLQKSTYELKITIDSVINLIEVRELIPNLEIFYKGEDILKNNKEIKIVLLTISNEGEVIHQNYYDKNKPFGLKFQNSIILSTEIKESNCDYLKENILQQPIVFEVSDDNEVKAVNGYQQNLPKEDELFLSKLIIEKGKYITFKLYLLCPVDIDLVNISFIGKIANIDKVKILYN